VEFLTANKERNFVKSHGREAQRFIQKQGLDKSFVECEAHMWRVGDRSLPADIVIDGGSDWLALSRPFVHYLTTSPTDPLLKGLITLFKYTLLPAEVDRTLE
jgi:protein xylosyltransferase